MKRIEKKIIRITWLLTAINSENWMATHHSFMPNTSGQTNYRFLVVGVICMIQSPHFLFASQTRGSKGGLPIQVRICSLGGNSYL